MAFYLAGQGKEVYVVTSRSVPDVHLISLRPAMEGLIVPSKCYGIIAAGRPVLFAGDPQREIPPMIQAANCGVGVGVGEGEALAEWILQLPRAEPLRTWWGKPEIIAGDCVEGLGERSFKF